MPVIKPTRSFEGSDLSTSVFGRIVKDGVRVINFRDEKNSAGNFFFILPPYKADSYGKGISWKVLPVRDNFGIEPKELFPIGPNCPISYFSNQAKLRYAQYAKTEKVMVDGRMVNKYPSFGRPVNKVLFNSSYMKEPALGAHVLTLPQFGAAEQIERWNRRVLPNGGEAPLINDPERITPIWIQLKKNAVGNPWVVTPDPSQYYTLPPELSDSEYLYNLDDIICYPDPELLIAKLRTFTPADIFNACIAGYRQNDATTVSMAVPTAESKPAMPQAAPVATPVAISAPIAKATVGPAPVADVVPKVHVEATANPMQEAPKQWSIEEAKRYLSQQKA